MPQIAKHDEYSSFSKRESTKIPLMICSSPTVRLISHCFTTSTTRTNWTGSAKRNMPLYRSYQFVYIGQPSISSTQFQKERSIFNAVIRVCLLFTYIIRLVIANDQGLEGGVLIPHSRPLLARIPHPTRFSSVSRITRFFPRKMH